MRLRVGHKPDDWLELGPGHGGSVKLGGSLVTGAPGPNDPDLHRAQKAASKARRNAPVVRSPRKRISDMTELEAERRRQQWRDAGIRKRERRAA